MAVWLSGPSNEVTLVVGSTALAPPPSPTSPIAAPGLPPQFAAGWTFACSLDAIGYPAACVNSVFGNATAPAPQRLDATSQFLAD
ncbi:MAG TPA: hypothetical protein VKE51_23485 [Vicinamibacterales bacterium]|nr:hypothetical protein [Vicinamibacterales bacterium]